MDLPPRQTPENRAEAQSTFFEACRDLIRAEIYMVATVLVLAATYRWRDLPDHKTTFYEDGSWKTTGPRKRDSRSGLVVFREYNGPDAKNRHIHDHRIVAVDRRGTREETIVHGVIDRVKQREQQRQRMLQSESPTALASQQTAETSEMLET